MSVFKITLRLLRILFSRWLFFVHALTIIGATSPPMTIVIIISDFVVVRAINKRMSRLIDSILAVANGDMDVPMDTKGSEEYAEIYRDFNLMVRERLLCKNPACTRKTFQLEYKNHACKPGMREKIVEMLMNGSGTRDTGRMLPGLSVEYTLSA